MTETDLRWQLRQLPRAIDLPRDLWPGIASAIAQPVARARQRWLPRLAVAATLALAVGLTWRALPPRTAIGPDPQARLLTREASAMTREYHAALRQFDGVPMSSVVGPGLKALDRSAVQIRSALVVDPDSVALLQQLRRTYSRRLALTQRAITS